MKKIQFGIFFVMDTIETGERCGEGGRRCLSEN